MRISLCITTYNKPDLLGRILRNALAMYDLPDEIIVCDDGSTEETGACVRSYAAQSPVPVIHAWQTDDGWQVSRVRNLGIGKATGDYIVFIDGDCIPHRKFIRDHRRLAEPGYVVLGDRCHVKENFQDGFSPVIYKLYVSILRKRLRKRFHALRLPWEQPEIFTLNELTPLRLAEVTVGCNFAFWRKDALAINGFNEELTGWSLEDVEMVARLLVHGIRAKKVRQTAIVYHLDHGDPVYDEQLVLNRIEEIFKRSMKDVSQG